MDKKAETAARLNEFGLKRFGSAHGWKSRFAESLGMPPQQLHKLLTGINNIGAITQNKLRDLGCDIDWLMTGSGHADKLVFMEEATLYKSRPAVDKSNRVKLISEWMISGDAESLDLMERIAKKVYKID